MELSAWQHAAQVCAEGEGVSSAGEGRQQHVERHWGRPKGDFALLHCERQEMFLYSLCISFHLFIYLFLNIWMK